MPLSIYTTIRICFFFFKAKFAKTFFKRLLNEGTFEANLDKLDFIT